MQNKGTLTEFVDVTKKGSTAKVDVKDLREASIQLV